MERTEEEQKRLSTTIAGLLPDDLWAIVEDVVGPRRTVELTGWALLWRLQGETSGAELRRKMEARGLHERAAYRALADYRRIGDRLLALPSPPAEVGPEDPGPGAASILRKMALASA